VNIQYEEDEKSQKKPYNKDNTNPKSSTNKEQYKNNKGGSGSLSTKNFQNKKFKKNYNSEGNNNNNNYNQAPQKLGSNKFDAVNNQYMMPNPYMFSQQMPRPELAPQQGNFNTSGSNDYIQNFQKIDLEAEDKRILDALEYYFSIENLNKDSFIRGKLDENGYLNAEEIITFNKMKKASVTIEKIREILNKFDSVIESKVENDKLFLRNKNWETIKDKLTSLETIQEQKKKKQQYHVHQNNNYVSMQNNFYYQFNPYAHQHLFPGAIEQQQQQAAYFNPQMMGGYQPNIPFQQMYGQYPNSFQQQPPQDNPQDNNNNY